MRKVIIILVTVSSDLFLIENSILAWNSSHYSNPFNDLFVRGGTVDDLGNNLLMSAFQVGSSSYQGPTTGKGFRVRS